MLKLTIEVEEGGLAQVLAQDRVGGPVQKIACCGVSGPDAAGAFRTDGEQANESLSDETSALLWAAVAATYAALYQQLLDEEATARHSEEQ